MISNQSHARPGYSLSWQFIDENGQVTILKASKHAILRMAQRNISLRDLEYVLIHGERVYRTGATIYVLRKRDIPQNDRKKSEIARLEGTAVLIDSTPGGNLEIITMYRNKSAFRAIQCKTKYDNRGKFKANRKPSREE